MEYVILDESIKIDNMNYGTFVYILNITNDTIVAQVSNTEIICNIAILDNDIENSVKNYFKNLGE